MKRKLHNRTWALYVMPRLQATGEVVWSWGLYGSHTEDPLLEQATFGLEYRRRGRYRHLPLVERLVEHGTQGPLQGWWTWMADSQGLAPRLEVELHSQLPLVRWRVQWQHTGARPVEVERVVLLEVGPLASLASSRHRWGLGFIPVGFLRMRRPGREEPGALRLHPSPGALRLLGPPWPWEHQMAEYSPEQPYLPPRGLRTYGQMIPPRPQGATHAVIQNWAVLWDIDHQRALLLGARSGREQVLVEARMEALHPAVRLWYRPRHTRWLPGHRETSPWAVLCFAHQDHSGGFHAFWEALELTDHQLIQKVMHRLTQPAGR